MGIREQHQELGQRLIDGRAAGTLTEAREEDLSWEMEKLWRQMNVNDHAWFYSQPSPYKRCPSCGKWVVVGDDSALLCLACGGKNRRSEP